MFLGPARGRGLFTGSLENIVAAIPKHNGYHFRGDSAYTSILASVIAHRFRLVNAKVKVVPEDFLQQLIDEFPFDERKQREFLMHPHRFFAKPTVPAYIERFRIGVVRGLLGKCKGTWLGTRGLVHIAAHDNKGLFLFPILTGRSEGPRGEYADGGIFPTWVCASGGQNEKIAYCIGDSDITTCWYVDETRESVGAYKGKPYLAKGEYPPSLYHQATHDAAFAVLESSFFIPGHGTRFEVPAAEGPEDEVLEVAVEPLAIRDATAENILPEEFPVQSPLRAQSLDSEALEKAKQQKGYSTIVERFDGDVEFTMSSIQGGVRVLATQDCRQSCGIHETTYLDCNLDYTALEWVDRLWTRFHRQVDAAKRTYEEKLRNAELARAAQAKADARREAYQEPSPSSYSYHRRWYN
eukprot:s7731_g2.t1